MISQLYSERYYRNAYFVTGSTAKISSGGGFEWEAPIYQLIEDMMESGNDITQYYSACYLCAGKYCILIQALGRSACIRRTGLGNGEYTGEAFIEAENSVDESIKRL